MARRGVNEGKAELKIGRDKSRRVRASKVEVARRPVEVAFYREAICWRGLKYVREASAGNASQQ